MKKRILSLFLALTLCLTLTPTGALAEESLPEQTVVATQETETPTPAPQKEEPLPEQTVAATQETETPTPAPQKEESLPEQTVVATQETETPTPVPQKEEPTAPAENGADENASPASPDEKPTENTPAAAEKNPADEGPGKEPAAAMGKDESKADGSPSDDDAAKVQNRLVMAAAAEPGEPTMMGQNNLLALADEEQNAAEGENGEAGGTPCDHNGTNGFDINALTCPDCGAPAVAQTALTGVSGNPWRNFANLQDALDATRDGGSTLRLLANVTGDYTIDGTQTTGISLGDYVIDGTVTIKAATDKYNSVSFSSNRSNISITKMIAEKGANIYSTEQDTEEGTFNAIIGTLELADTTNWADILYVPEQYGYKQYTEYPNLTEYKWYAPAEVEAAALTNVVVKRLPITSKTLNLKVDGKNINRSSVERGTTVQLCAGCNTKGATVEFSILKEGETTPITLSGNDVQYTTVGTGTTKFYVAEYTFNDVGSYTISFTATKDGYTVQSNARPLTVTKPNLSKAEITFRSSNESAYEPYNATTSAPPYTVTYNGKELTEDVDYTVTGDSSEKGAGKTCTLTIKAVEDGEYTGKKTAQWKIVPHKVKVSVGDVIKAYDGTTALPDGKISLVSAGSAFTLDGQRLPLTAGNGYELTDAKYDSANASETEKNISFTVKLTDTNYTFEDGTKEKAFTLNGAELEDKAFKINQASVKSPGEITQYVYNDAAKTYTLNLASLRPQLTPPCEYGTTQYQGCNYEFTDGAYLVGTDAISVSKEGILTLRTVAVHSSDVNQQIGTITVPVVTTNYQKFEFTINVVIGEKIWLDQSGVTVTATDITYGQTLADSTLTATGSMICPHTKKAIPGTFAWTNKDFKPDASDSYEAEWTFTPAAGYEEYATATGTVTIKVNKATPTFTAPTAQENLTYTGQEQALITAGSTQDGTMKYRLGESGEFVDSIPNGKDAGTYTVYYKVVGDENHNDTEVQFVSVTIDPLPISLLSVSSISKAYDGSADVALTADKLTFFSTTAKAMNIKLPNTALSFSEAKFTKQQADGSYLPSPEVGGGKALSFTMTLTSNNYVFEGKSEGTVSNVFATDEVNRFTITKAAAPMMQPIELTVINGLAKTYLVNLPALPTLGDNCKYGSIKYEACNFNLIGEGGYANSTATITSNDEFQLAVPAVESQTEGSVGTVDVKITTDNYQDMFLTVEVIAKNKIVPVLDGKITATPITFGQILRVSTITGTMKDDGKTVEGTFEWTDPSTKPDKAGDYQAEWTFTPAEGYEEYATATGTVTIKVDKADPAFTAPTAQENLTYTGQEQALITAGSVTDYSTMQYSLTENGTYSQDIPTGTDAGAYTVWYRVIGDANHNDTAPASVAVSIGKKPLTITGVTAASKPYDGTTNADISSVTFDNVTLNRGTDYNVTASFDDASVGNRKNITATVTLMDQAAKNYFLEQSSFTTTASITKAAAPTNIQSGTLTITNGLHKTYSFDLSTLLPKLTAPCDYGTITYDKKVDTNLGVGSFITLVNGKTGELTLEANRSGTDEGQFGTITVTISTSNYENITLTVNVSAVNQITPVPEDGTITATPITYGNKLSTSTITGTMQDPTTREEVTGTFTWVTPAVKLNAGSYEAEWTFTPDKSYGGKYTTYTDTATVKVTPREITVSITPNGGIYGETITPATVTANDVVGEDAPEITLTYTGTANDGTEYTGTTLPTKAGTYTVTATTTDHNYTLDPDTTTADFTIEPKSIKGAKVVLGKGLTANGAEQTQTVEKVLLDGKELPADSYTVADNTATAPGSHTLTITAKGNYTGTVKQTYVIIPAKAEDAPGAEIAIGSGKVKVVVKSEGAVPPAALLTDKAELLAMLVDSGDITADELAQIADGASVDIVLTVKEANVPDEVKTAMAQAAKGCTIGHYLDISLFKYMTVNGKQQDGVALRTTKNALTISVVVPDALINTNSAVNRTYCIVRNHEGTITVLDAAFDAAGKTLTFKTDRFSIYAIAYKDTAVPGSGSNPSSNNSSNDSETKKNEVAAPTPAPTPASTSKPSTVTAMPQTGDTSNPTLYVVLLVASLLGLAVVFVCKKRNDK